MTPQIKSLLDAVPELEAELFHALRDDRNAEIAPELLPAILELAKKESKGCDWKASAFMAAGVGWVERESACGFFYTIREPDDFKFIYCPNCGKKIEVK